MSFETDEIEIKDALATLTKSIGERVGGIEKKMAEFADLSDAFNKLQAKMNRPGVGSSEGNFSEAESKSLRTFLRTGEVEVKSTAMLAGSAPDGGFTVPSGLGAQIEALELKQSAMRQVARIVPVTVANYEQIVNKRGTGSTWTGETQTRPATTTPALAAVGFNDCELTANPQITQRLLDDSAYNLDAWIAEELADAFVASEGDAFINGATPTRPQGFLTLKDAPVATDDSTRAFGTLQYVASGDATAFPTTDPGDPLISLIFSLKPKYRQGAVWLMNPNTLATVSKFKDSQHRYLFQPSLVAGTPAMLLGYPIYEDENMPAVGANAFPIAFGNFNRGYYILDRQAIRILRDPFSNKPYVGFYSTKRVSGNVVNSECIKLLKCATS